MPRIGGRNYQVTQGADGKMCICTKNPEEKAFLLKYLTKRNVKTLPPKKPAARPAPHKVYILGADNKRADTLAEQFHKKHSEAKEHTEREQAKTREAVAKAQLAEERLKEKMAVKPKPSVLEVANRHRPGVGRLPQVIPAGEQKRRPEGVAPGETYEVKRGRLLIQEQYGEGHGYVTSAGFLNTRLQPIPGFQGCFAIDEINKVPVSPTTDSSFILNSDKHGQPGTHWVAVWISPAKDKSVELYDSLADKSPLNVPEVVKGLRLLVNKLHLPYRLKFKHSTVRQQRLNSSTCGLMSASFLLDRARGKTFAEASKYDSISEAEKHSHVLAKEFGYL